MAVVNGLHATMAPLSGGTQLENLINKCEYASSERFRFQDENKRLIAGSRSNSTRCTAHLRVIESHGGLIRRRFVTLGEILSSRRPEWAETRLNSRVIIAVDHLRWRFETVTGSRCAGNAEQVDGAHNGRSVAAEFSPFKKSRLPGPFAGARQLVKHFVSLFRVFFLFFLLVALVWLGIGRLGARRLVYYRVQATLALAAHCSLFPIRGPVPPVFVVGRRFDPAL